jgi:hypothetical protein
LGDVDSALGYLEKIETAINCLAEINIIKTKNAFKLKPRCIFCYEKKWSLESYVNFSLRLLDYNSV